MRYLVLAVAWLMGCFLGTQIPALAAAVPQYAVDAAWPKPLPNDWQVGQIAGVAVDAQDHVWVVQRPRTLTEDERGAALNPPRSLCCVPAPPVLEFDAEGNLLGSWGGPGVGYDWPLNEHGIYVDSQGNVWIAGNDPKDHQLLKFTRTGKFLLQIGKAGQTGGSNSTDLLGRPANVEVDAATHEVFVADGYLNRRIVVFDADTGRYKRHWGAYGKAPNDAPMPKYEPGQRPAQQFANPVHCVRLANDGLVFVCDRVNDRVQVFRRDGAFVKEFFIAPKTLGNGSVWDLVLSRDAQQTWLHIVDGENNRVWTVRRETGEMASAFGRNGRNAGQFHWVHDVAIDSKGNLYTGEVDTGKRVQKFTYRGESATGH